MALPALIPRKAELPIYQGSRINYAVQLTDKVTTTPLDLTDLTSVGYIKYKYDDCDVALELACDVVIPETDGTITITATTEDVENLLVNCDDKRLNKSVIDSWSWSLYLVDSSGERQLIFFGPAPFYRTSL